MKADERDILLVATISERRLYRQFTDRQIVSPASVTRVEGRRVRYAFATDPFYTSRDRDRTEDVVERAMARNPRGSSRHIQPVAQWANVYIEDELMELQLHVKAELLRISTETGVQVQLGVTQ